MPQKSNYSAHFSLPRKPEIIAIGSSTGGPHALFEVISHLGALNTPIVITQHMPATFTTILAQHITEKTGVPAHEGSHGMSVQNGHVYVAPGGYHMVFARKGARLLIQLDDRSPVNYCKPSVDVMFSSLADLYDERVLGIILTGMGNDGLDGSKKLISKNNAIIAQDQESCVVWGMPRAVEEAGLCKAVLPLSEIGPKIKTLFRART